LAGSEIKLDGEQPVADSERPSTRRMLLLLLLLSSEIALIQVLQLDDVSKARIQKDAYQAKRLEFFLVCRPYVLAGIRLL
jgi:hypothetical protein